MKERQQRLEMQRIELEEEASRLRAAAASERLQHEENLMNAKQRIKSEEVCGSCGFSSEICLSANLALANTIKQFIWR